MGSPLAPVLACLYMGYFETELRHNICGPQPSFWVRYIDDILLQWSGSLDELNTFSISLHNLKILSTYRLNGKLQTLFNLVMQLSYSLIFLSNAPLPASSSQVIVSQLPLTSMRITAHLTPSPKRKGILLDSFSEVIGHVALKPSMMRSKT